MMDADTTGIEPDIALMTYKKRVVGLLKIVNQTVFETLCRLGYNPEEAKKIVERVNVPRATPLHPRR